MTKMQTMRKNKTTLSAKKSVFVNSKTNFTACKASRWLRTILDFPQPGIVFTDLTNLIKNPLEISQIAHTLSEFILAQKATVILAIEARGFIFAAHVNYLTQTKLVLLRKAGKVCGPKYQIQADCEYASRVFELPQDSFEPTDRVVIIDDFIATGKTIAAAKTIITENFNCQIVGAGAVVVKKNHLWQEQLLDLPTKFIYEVD